MDFSLDDDHLALQDAVRRFCDGEYPLQHRGNPEPRELAESRWQAMAGMGLTGLPFDPELGGGGQGAVEMMLVAQELGRSLGGGAWLSSVVLAGQLLAEAGTPLQTSRWLPRIADGSKRIALAFAERGGRYDPAYVRTSAAQSAASAVAHAPGFRIDGFKTLVLDGIGADAFLVSVRTSGDSSDEAGISLFIVEADAPGLTVGAVSTLDGRYAADLSFDGVQIAAGALVGDLGAALPLLDKAIDRAAAALCAEASGAIDALIDMTTEHLKTRVQFGAPLAKFQVLQHRIADMLIASEQTRSVASAAAMSVEAKVDVRRRLVSAAKIISGQAGRQVGQWAIQLHGAMGMTDESRVGHYVKRLLVINQLFGDSSHHLRRLADMPQA